MHLQFVGCGDAFGSGGRFNTCFHLVGQEINALIDCGATSLVAMNKLAIDPNDVNTIFISHFHADHVGGLPFFILDANYVLKRERALTIAGPPSLKARYAEIMDDRLSGTKTMQLSFPVTLQELEIGKRSEHRRTCTSRRSTSCMTIAPALASASASRPKARSSLFPATPNGPTSLIDIGPRSRSVHLRSLYARQGRHDAHGAVTLERHLGQIRPKRLILTHMSNDMLARRAELPLRDRRRRNDRRAVSGCPSPPP